MTRDVARELAGVALIFLGAVAYGGCAVWLFVDNRAWQALTMLAAALTMLAGRTLARWDREAAAARRAQRAAERDARRQAAEMAASEQGADGRVRMPRLPAD